MGFGLLLIIIVAFVLLFDGGAFIKRFLSTTDISKSEDISNPRKILDARLTRGEIDLDEYKNIRKHLEETEGVQ